MNWHAAQGATAKRAGGEFEKRIEHQLIVACEANLVSWWHHTQASYRYVNGRTVPVKRGPADFTGTLNGGLAFAVEAKTTVCARFYKNDVLPKQQEHLDATVRSSAVSLLALEFRHTGGAPAPFVVPWHLVPWKRLRSTDSVSAADLSGWELEDPIFMRRFVDQCGRCLQVRQVRVHFNRPVAFCQCGAA